MVYQSIYPPANKPFSDGERCTAAANLRGEHVQCDLFKSHPGWAHASREHELLWENLGSSGPVMR